MHGTRQNWNLVCKWGPYDNHTQPWTNPRPQGGFGIDSRIGAAAPRASAASREDSCPQAILKFQPCDSFNYRIRYEPQLLPQRMLKRHLKFKFKNQMDLSDYKRMIVLRNRFPLYKECVNEGVFLKLSPNLDVNFSSLSLT